MSDEPVRLPRLIESHSAAAYHAGRLLAVCQMVQDTEDRDINATFTDRYFAAATNCPARVLPQVMNTTLRRNRKLFRRNAPLAAEFRDLIYRIHARINRFPNVLNMHGKADFQLGYFHQHASRISTDRQGTRRYRTNDGQSVKSIGEQHISNLLHASQIEYVYEDTIEFKDSEGNAKSIRPDFSISHGQSSLWIEYLGMEDDEKYENRWRWKVGAIETRLDGRNWRDVDTDDRITPLTFLAIVPAELKSPDDDNRILNIVARWRSRVDG